MLVGVWSAIFVVGAAFLVLACTRKGIVEIQGILKFPPIIDVVALRVLIGTVGLVSLAVALLGVTGVFDGRDADPVAALVPTTSAAASPTVPSSTVPSPTRPTGPTGPAPDPTDTMTASPTPTGGASTAPGPSSAGSTGGTTGQADPVPPTTTPPPPPPTHPVDPAAQRLRHGTLVVRSYVAVDLDSTAADWGAYKGSWEGVRNLEWDGDPKSIGIDNYPDSTAVLPAAAPSDFTACSVAKGGDPAGGAAGLHAGERFCVRTRVGHLVLLLVKKVVPGDYGSLTLDATVWRG